MIRTTGNKAPSMFIIFSLVYLFVFGVYFAGLYSLEIKRKKWRKEANQRSDGYVWDLFIVEEKGSGKDLL